MNATQPTLTISIPTFNRPALVAAAIRSVVEAGAGPHSEVELIVSDNSPGVSEDVCRQALAAWDGPSRYIPNRTDIGMVANFNQCVGAASGEYVLVLHDDDRLLPGAIPAILAAIHGSQADQQVLLFRAQVKDEHGRVRRRNEGGPNEILSRGTALRRVLSDSSFVRFPAVVVRRDAYSEVGPFDPTVGNVADLDMWIRLFARFGVRIVAVTTSIYSVHPEASTAGMFNADTVATLMTVFDRARRTGLLSDRTIRRCQVDFMHQFIMGGALRSLRAGDNRAARSVLRLFGLPTVQILGQSRRWLPFKLGLTVIVRLPSWISLELIALADRLELERRVLAIR